MHNVSNALASIALGHLLRLSEEVIIKGLGSFTGTDRRFQYKGEVAGVTVIDDYAHHPTEIEATLHAAGNYPHQKSGVYSSRTHTPAQRRFFLNLQKRSLLRITLSWLIFTQQEKPTLSEFPQRIFRNASRSLEHPVNISRPLTKLKTSFWKTAPEAIFLSQWRRRRCKYRRTSSRKISYPHYPHVYTHFSCVWHVDFLCISNLT
mgnify:CR=1 FL=1